MASSGETSSVLKNMDLFSSNTTSSLMSNVMDFELFDDYLFVVKNLSVGEVAAGWLFLRIDVFFAV